MFKSAAPYWFTLIAVLSIRLLFFVHLGVFRWICFKICARTGDREHPNPDYIICVCSIRGCRNLNFYTFVEEGVTFSPWLLAAHPNYKGKKMSPTFSSSSPHQRQKSKSVNNKRKSNNNKKKQNKKKKDKSKKGKNIEISNETHPSYSQRDTPLTGAAHVATPPIHQSNSNPLLQQQQTFLKSIPTEKRNNFFSDQHVSSEERAEIWEEQADIGETLINQYAWATPDHRALTILKHFHPIIEIGSGSNAYWGKCMKRFGIDVVCYDLFPTRGGHILSREEQQQRETHQRKKRRHCSEEHNNTKDGNSNTDIIVKKGGPEVLSRPQNKHRTLFLCYPDEVESSSSVSPIASSSSTSASASASASIISMAAQCLRYYQGTYIIHVGELFGDPISLDPHQAPWGRSSSWKFQVELQKSFHCVLKCRLRSAWLHVHDTITVWKRTTVICTMVFAAGDSSDDENGDDNGVDEEVQYKHIPLEERLPMDVAAPCMQRLLDIPSEPELNV